MPGMGPVVACGKRGLLWLSGESGLGGYGASHAVREAGTAGGFWGRMGMAGTCMPLSSLRASGKSCRAAVFAGR